MRVKNGQGSVYATYEMLNSGRECILFAIGNAIIICHDEDNFELQSEEKLLKKVNDYVIHFSEKYQDFSIMVHRHEVSLDIKVKAYDKGTMDEVDLSKLGDVKFNIDNVVDIFKGLKH